MRCELSCGPSLGLGLSLTLAPQSLTLTLAPSLSLLAWTIAHCLDLGPCPPRIGLCLCLANQLATSLSLAPYWHCLWPLLLAVGSRLFPRRCFAGLGIPLAFTPTLGHGPLSCLSLSLSLPRSVYV